ncbi:peroxidase 16-like [Henckelia pumila]|uniref:peroxidase 16-like n=1 Tax=Henckelia pumila TaxID=405737 RepID=UPI003C6DEF6A
MKSQKPLICHPLFPFLLLHQIFGVAASHAQPTPLSTNFYRNICPNVESLVRAAVETKFRQTFVTAPATLRLFFHDCFVRGCDGSILLASPNGKAEKDHPDNLSLAGDGFDTIIKAKLAVDSIAQCRNKVSCADILALAARDAVNLAGGPFYGVELGRRDGGISTMGSVQRKIPGPGFSLNHLTSMFSRHNLHLTDLIALSGAHTIGFSHCGRFSHRIYNFSRSSSIDPTLNTAYAMQLREMCPRNVDPRIAINMDPATFNTFDNAYYRNLIEGKGLFTSDQELFTDSRSRATVNLFASNSAAFGDAFALAMIKLGRIGVLTGNKGEIRIDCSKPN